MTATERTLDKLPAWFTERIADYEYLGYTFSHESDGGWHFVTVTVFGREIGRMRGILLGYAFGEALAMCEAEVERYRKEKGL